MTFTPVPDHLQRWTGSLSFGGSFAGGATMTPAETSDPDGLGSISSTNIVIAKTGTYHISAMVHSSSQQFNDGRGLFVNIRVNGTDQTLAMGSSSNTTDAVNGNSGGGHARAHASCNVSLTAGDNVSIAAAVSGAGFSETLDDGFVEILFIPTFNFPS